MSTRTEIEDRAAQWLAQQDREFEEEDRHALEAWLAESTAHRVAYLRLKTAWDRAERLSVLSNPALERMATPRFAKHRIRIAGLAAGIALAVGGLVVVTSSTAPTAEYGTSIGGREVVPLADGSKLELNTDTQVRTSLTSQTRTVWLERGEVFFDVVRDVARPFVVIAGARQITVLGTTFAVRRDGEDVQVKVLEGKVQVDALSRPSAVADAATLRAVITGGQVAVTKQDSTLVAHRSPQDIANELAWRQGMLVMNQWTLGDAAREFNRYNRKKLIVRESVSKLRVGGSFESGNVEAFSRLLKDGFGLRIETSSDQIIVSD